MSGGSNLGWPQLVEIFSDRFRRDVTDKITVGPLLVGNDKIAGVMVHCHSEGLFVSRRPFPWFRGRLWIPWALIRSVHVLPSPLRGNLSTHTDANITIGDEDQIRMQIPWHESFSEALPDGIHLVAVSKA